MYDIKNKIITNKSNVILFIAGLVLLISNNINYSNILKLILFKCLIIALTLLFLSLLRIIFKNNIGGGDIKMICALMINNNLSNMIGIITLSVFTSLIFALYLLLIKHKKKDYKFSFGEFISLATIIVTLLN